MTNNNESMKTVVETFIIEETQDLIHDNDKLETWNKLVGDLELKGQTSIVKEGKSPIPFLFMKPGLVKTFTVLCPTYVPLEEYDKSPIPVEILELCALSKKEGYFDKIQIWYDDKTPDPVCVGLKMKENDPHYAGQDWYIQSYSDKYLLGRWADVRASLDSLIEKAKKLFATRMIVSIKQSLKEKQRELDDIQTTIDREFGSPLPETDLPF